MSWRLGTGGAKGVARSLTPNHQSPNTPPNYMTRPSSLFRHRLTGGLAAGLLVLSSTLASAGDHTKDMGKSIVEPEPSRWHVLINNEFSTDYITPRGIHAENQGVVWQPLVL